MIDLWDVAGALLLLLILIIPLLIVGGLPVETLIGIIGLFVAAIAFAKQGEK
ncbi:hypothetical protein [Rubinisphaera sp.]|uniref:hypothetical protein n=1 Tax=Rubinisphaera sp. TaxID=2024857 RepID=UPI0025E68E3D|nr:hypothetical protein [Rubinisphaera sp.]|tara:strand:- start:6514 stop:6669 length:156 start_codon:yes stop_codon:yes gene_type:complete